MRFEPFIENVHWCEGVLAPDKTRLVGIPKTNTTQMTNQQRQEFYPQKPLKPESLTLNMPVFKPFQPAQLPKFKTFKSAQPAKIVLHAGAQ